jgi:hypothetical protein
MPFNHNLSVALNQRILSPSDVSSQHSYTGFVNLLPALKEVFSTFLLPTHLVCCKSDLEEVMLSQISEAPSVLL